MSILNPDGFVYSFETDRTWRKTRSYNHDGTRGVDPNRNWDWNWGCSSRPSSSSYCGPSPHSEPETRQAAGYILAEKSIVAGFDMHTSGRWILRAWTFSHADSPVEEYSEEVGELYRRAVLATHGRNYRNVKGIDGLGPAAGCLEDWFAGGPGNLPIPRGRSGGGDPYLSAVNTTVGRNEVAALLPYTIEISTSQTPPPSTILEDVEENYAGILAAMEYVGANYEVRAGHAYRK